MSTRLPSAETVSWVTLAGGAASLVGALLTGALPAGSAVPPSLLADVFKMAAYTGCVLVAGAVIFWVLLERTVRPERSRMLHVFVLGTLCLALSAVLNLAWCLLGDGAGARMWGASSVRLFAAIVAGGIAWVLHRGGAVPGVLLLAPAVAITVVTARPEPLSGLTIAVTTAHVLAASAWLGGLCALAVAFLPRPDTEILHQLVSRFPAVSITAVVVLAASGTFHAWAVAGSWHGLATSSYGRMLVDKLVMVGGMLLAAIGSHQYVKSLGRRTHPVQVLGICVGVEMAFGIGALWLTAELTRLAFTG